MKRIGILGGTFNPVHLGHLVIGQAVCEQLKLDKVIFVPSNRPPHKIVKKIASSKDRYNMLRLSVKGNPNFEVSDFEITREGKSFSINTVSHFRKVYPLRTKFFFIIGSDLLPTLHLWRQFDELCRMVSFVAVKRPGFGGMDAKIPIKTIVVPLLDVSSSDIRRRVKSNKAIQYFVPQNVLNYIRDKKVYR